MVLFARMYTAAPLFLVVAAAAGCSLEPGGVLAQVAAIASPYAAPVRQGNWVDPEAVAQLRPGMSKEQVRLLLGSPLLVDPFRPNRWDYLYRYDDKKGHIEARRLTLFFAEERLERIDSEGVALPELQPPEGSR